MESLPANYHPVPAKLIFNPVAGAAAESPVQLMDVINELQTWKFVPETYLVKPDCNLLAVVQDALARGIRMFVVCGGDGTIESVTEALVDTDAILGIIPTGTRNNVAFSLGIVEEIPSAVSLLRTGLPIKLDVGFASCGDLSRVFLETCSVGLFSALFQATDDIQHGNLGSIGDFLAALISSPLAEMRLTMDNQPEITIQGHVALAANLPYAGPRFPIASECSFNDGLLDVIVFPDQSKLDLLANIVQMAGGSPDDPRIQRFQAQKVEIHTNPPMPVMADGFSLGEGPVNISVRQSALTVMASEAAPILHMGKKDCLEKEAALAGPKVMAEA